MSNPNKHIEEYLDSYIGIDKPGFAVLITGPWGCGKTHYIDGYIGSKKQEEQKQFIRISLNGMAETAEICSQILTQLCPNKLSKTLPIIGKLATGASKFFNVDGVITPDDLVELRKSTLAEKTLVVDDLERCCMPITRTLGFLSSFIENYGMSVILLGYEDEITPGAPYIETEPNSGTDANGSPVVEKPTQEQIQYRRIREKVIGKRFAIEEYAEYVVPELIKKQKKQIQTILKENVNVIVAIIKNAASGRRREYNYRAMQHTLRDFQFYTSKIDAKYRKHPELMRDFLHAYCVMGYEIQLGNICATDIRKLKDYFDYLVSGSKDPNKIDVILERHSIGHDNLLLDKELWAQIFENNAVPKEDLNEALSHSKHFFQANQPEDYVVLWHWRDQQDDVANEIIETVFQGLENHKYRVPGEILQIFGSLLSLSKQKAIEKGKAEILQQALEYIEYLASISGFDIRTEQNRFLDDLMQFGHGHLGYMAKDTAEFSAIGTLLIDKAKEVARAQTVKDIPNILEALIEDTNGTCERLVDGDLRRVDIFTEIKAEEFLETFMKIPNVDKKEVAFMLQNRYRGISPAFDSVLRKEHQFLVELDKLAEEKLAAAEKMTPSLEQLRLTRISYLSAAIDSTSPVEMAKRDHSEPQANDETDQ